ncbi:MAG: photosystem I reaction center subunit XII [Moorea sp. SIO3C2]|nr:photosystem I reaction center subunit XII [Moorena sp. SIO3C2]
MGNLTVSATLGLDAFEGDPVELRPYATEEDVLTVIRAVYKQVLGNAHLMASERISNGESMLRNGDISVRGFVRMVAQSALYQSRFFEGSSPYQFIELNCKHLLGRAPLDQAEISEHVSLYNEQGYEAEIDSYINSDEYLENFGDNIVPYPRSIRSQPGIKNVGFNRMFSLLRGSPTSDSGKPAQLITSVAANISPQVKAPAVGNGAGYGNTGKRYQIAVSTCAGVARLNKCSQLNYQVSYEQLSEQVKSIHKGGGKILSITELT